MPEKIIVKLDPWIIGIDCLLDEEQTGSDADNLTPLQRSVQLNFKNWPNDIHVITTPDGNLLIVDAMSGKGKNPTEEQMIIIYNEYVRQNIAYVIQPTPEKDNSDI
jgi:hypothetical protein